MRSEADDVVRVDQRSDPAAAGVTIAPLVGDDVVRFDPTWCLFWGKRIRTFQLDIWIAYIRRSRHRFAIMTAADDAYQRDREKIAALPNAMLIEPWEEGLEWLRHCSDFQGYLYIGTQPENFLAVNRQRRKAHVYIGHGESGKGTSGFRTGSLYDSIFVAEYSVVRRFPGAIRPWVWKGACAVGTAVVEGVRKDAWSRPRTVKTILYAPTWESGHLRGDFTSLDVVAPVLIDLLPSLTARGIEVLLRPHPGTGARLPEMRTLLTQLEAAGATIGLAKAEAFERADVLISDISGVTAEFLLTEKPSIMPIVPKMAERNRGAAWLDVEYPWVYRWNATAAGLDALLTTIQTRDPLRERRASEAKKKFRHHRSLDDAVRTWEIGLDAVKWRRTLIPIRIPFEIGLLRERLRSRQTVERPRSDG